jgi:four helix bundle protein
MAMDLGELTWQIVDKWQWFVKKTIGTQYTRSADSVSSNIAEGWGRYSFQDKYNYFRIARGSLMEAMNWTAKANKRKLIKEDDLEKLKTIFNNLPHEINKLMSANKRKG